MPGKTGIATRLSKLAEPRGRSVAVQYAKRQLRELGRQPSLFVRRLVDWTRFKSSVHEYQLIDETELRRHRTSDTMFVFGSGMSLKSLTDAEWREIERHHTLGFNWFPRQRFVRCDYHLIREIAPGRGDDRTLRVQLEEYFDVLRANPYYRDTIFLVQTGWRAVNGNQAIGLQILPKTNRLFLWRTIIGRSEPSQSFSDGLTHAHGTLHECVNFAFLLGCTTIVLVGVDLYDRRHFWQTPEEAASPVWDETHNTARHGLVELMGRWRVIFEERGVHLYVYNQKSLLAGALPVWPRLRPGTQRSEDVTRSSTAAS